MEFGILGPLEIRDGEHIFDVGGAKQRAFLALLALHANEVVSSSRLLDALWGESPPRSGTTALQVLVSRARAALGEGGSLIVTKTPGYVLRVDPEQVDLHRFERLVAEAEAAAPGAAASRLREALALWRGPALADVTFESLARPAVGRLEDLRIVALERRIDADLALGRHTELVGELQQLVLEHPFRERLREQVMLAFYRSGRQAEALAAYAIARETLVQELGLDPGPGLQELERRILRQDPGLDLERAPTAVRSILVTAHDGGRLAVLTALADPLAGDPERELILTRLVSSDELGPATSQLRAIRDELAARDRIVRVAAFTSGRPARDIIRLATEQDADLLLVDGGTALLEDDVVRAVLVDAPCDVAVLAGSHESWSPGPVLVPFTGAEHDWSAVELAAWVARCEDVPLRLAGVRETHRDASRLLASASLAIQRALGVAAEPLLVEPGKEGLVRATSDASLVVVGLSERWQREGLGPVRRALATQAEAPTLLVRRGLRPGGLAPKEALTRFTWSVVVSSS